MIGVALFMGGESTPSRAVVQSAGYAYRLSAQKTKEEFNRHKAIVYCPIRQSKNHCKCLEIFKYEQSSSCVK